MANDPIWNLLNDPDWVYAPRHGYSLRRLREASPAGLPSESVASALLMTEEEEEEAFQETLTQLRSAMEG